uniref:LAGLIDADG endonuclease n=1 Tax=Amoeboaphelidium protococcarum TaxID=1243177 RepID=UPI0022373EEB
ENIAQDILFNLNFFTLPRIRAYKRIGPHNIDILSIIYGSLLGDSTLYNVKGNIRLRLEQKNKDYIYFLYNLFKNLGYTNTLPIINKRKNNNQTYYFYTYTFTSFINIYKDFYINNKKVIPDNIELYLTPLALAIWLMDDGAVQKTGLTLSTHCFTYSDILRICNILTIKYNLKVTINKDGKTKDGLNNQYRIRISQNSMENLINIVEPYMCPSMMYKLNKKIKN